MQKLVSYVLQAWNCTKMDDVLASARNMSREEGLLVCISWRWQSGHVLTRTSRWR